jgi:beta-glucosidase
VRELKGFRKIHTAPGESQEVEFTLKTSDLGYYDAAGRWLVEPGLYQVWLSKDSASGEPAQFEVTM